MKIFIALISVTTLVFLTSFLFSYYQIDKRYSIILAFTLFVAMSFAPLGIYSSLKNKEIENRQKLLNKVGLIGNSIIFALVLIIMIVVAYGKINE